MRASRAFAIVLAGGEGKRLAPLTADRAKPAVPFGGNYRLIDFALSNLVNAGQLKIAVLTQYKSESLGRHIATTWRLSPLLGNYVTPVPAQMRRGPNWFAGLGRRDLPEPEPDLRRAAALHLRLRRRPRLPDGSAPDARAAHRARLGAHDRRHPRPDRELTRVRRDRDRLRLAHDPGVPREAEGPGRDGRVARRGARVDGQLRVLGRRADRRRHSRRRRRDARRTTSAATSSPTLVERGQACVWDFANSKILGASERDLGYWRDVGTLDAYYDAHMDLISVDPMFNLYNEDWPILTWPEQLPPGEVRVRGGGPGRRRDELDGVRRRRRLGRHRAPLDPLARRARALARARRGLRRAARRRHRPRRDRAQRDPRQERADRARARASASIPRPTRRASRCRRTGSS